MWEYGGDILLGEHVGALMWRRQQQSGGEDGICWWSDCQGLGFRV